MTPINIKKVPIQSRLRAFFSKYIVLIFALFIAISVPVTTSAQTGDVDRLPSGVTYWAGDIVVHANADSFFVQAGRVVHHIASGDTVSFTGRLRSIRVSARNFRDSVVEFEQFTNEVRTFQVFLVPATDPGQMRENLFYYMHYDANLSIAANPDTRLYVDGVQAGTGQVMMKLPPGEYRLRSEEPGNGSRTRRITLTDSRLHHVDLHIQPTRSQIRQLSWIPGASQYRKHEKVKSVAFGAAVYGGILTSVVLHSNWRSRQNEFNTLRDKFWLENNEAEIPRLRDEVRRAESRTNKTGRQLTLAIGTTAVLYAWNVFDGLQTPRMGYRTEETFNPYIVLDAETLSPLLGMRYNF